NVTASSLFCSLSLHDALPIWFTCRPACEPAKERKMFRKLGFLVLAACAFQVQAKVDATQAARLGQDLTPLGAERAGNAAGSIPAWTGGVQPPAGYTPGMHHPDPFAADPVLYKVDQSNVSQYAALLPEGQRALLERYPDYYLRV